MVRLRSTSPVRWDPSRAGITWDAWGFFTGAPDLAVEVVSPSDTASEIEQKVQDYLRSGTQRVWVVYPDSRRVQVYSPDGTSRGYREDAAIEDQDLLPGFSLSLGEIFS
jgi:Uma2 family endonuclease